MNKNKKRNPVAQYFLGLALALDQMGAALRGWDHDETISSMLGKLQRHYGKSFAEKRRLAWLLAQALNKIERDHCENAIEPDEGKNALADKEIAIEGGN